MMETRRMMMEMMKMHENKHRGERSMGKYIRI